MKFPLDRALFVAVAGFALVLSARAQTQAARPTPRLGFAYPAGGQHGATFTVVLGGTNLRDAAAAYFSGQGVRAKVTGYERPLSQKEINDLREKAQQLQDKRAAARADPAKPAFTAADEKAAAEIRQTLATRGNRQATPAIAETVTLEITITPEAAPGARELRVRTPLGLSNPLVFCVGQLPETSEPAMIATTSREGYRARTAGKSAARIASVKEIALPATVNGQILPGETDRFRFRARKGQRLTFAAAARALTPYLADAVPGWFQATLALYDEHGREIAYDDDFHFNPDPVLACEIPADGIYALEIKDALYRGREDFVYRITAGELPFVTSIFPLGGEPTQPIAFDLKGWNLPAKTLEVDPRGKAPGVYLFSAVQQGMHSNAVRFALDARPSCLESEPADSSPAGQLLALPSIVNGRIDRPSDEDTVRFEGRAGMEIVAEVHARRLGSPLDSFLTITDAAGRTVATNDDFEDKGAGLLTHHADSRIALTLPGDGTYHVRVADAQGRGGADYGYRLRVGAPQPDFELRVVPSTINTRAGAAVPITVYALRRDGFTGEIALALQSAPKGTTLSGARIPAHEDVVRLTVNAPLAAREEPSRLVLTGTAAIGDLRVTHPAVPADDMMQAFAYRHLVAAKELTLCVTGRGTPLRVTNPLPVRISQTGVARIRVATPGWRNVRQPEFELMDPPPGISVRSVAHKGEFAEIVVVMDPAKTKPGARGNLIFSAYGERVSGSSSKPSARARRIPLGIVPAVPFEIESVKQPSS